MESVNSRFCKAVFVGELCEPWYMRTGINFVIHQSAFFDLGAEKVVKRISYNKLVRDKIPEIIETEGKVCRCRILGGEEYRCRLDAKLDEELAEFRESHELEELADVLEVLYATARAYGVEWDSVEKIRREKAEKRGGFDRRIFLESVDER